MIYSKWGGREDAPEISRLGFGTTRFNPLHLKEEKGLLKCVELVEYAIEKGINYFDVAPTYSYGYAEKILGDAFKNTKKEVYLAAKTGLMIDKTADDVLKRIDSSLKLLNKENIDFYHIWSVMNYEQYQTVLKTGGLYEGVYKAKEKGMIQHICISLHCDVEDTMRIVEEGLFEGITISMNAMNYRKWLPVLEKTRWKKMGVSTMNSLAGGVIPTYERLFRNIDDTNDSVSVKALRFLASFPEVSCILSGMSNKEQIDKNCSAFNEIAEDYQRKNFEIVTEERLCSGCNYCSPCAVGIPIAACMQAYNHKILVDSSDIPVDDQVLTNEMFIRMRANGVNFPKLKQCLNCHKCEKKCTQKIDISKRLKYIEKKAEEYGYTQTKMRERLREIEEICSEAKCIGIWPACDYATRVFDFWDNPNFESKCEFFNSSDAMQGKEYRGKKIRTLSEMNKLKVDTILITHYTLRNEIYDDLRSRVSEHIKIIKLNQDTDIDWFNRAVGK